MQGKENDGSGDGLVVFVLHLNDGLAGGALADVIERTLTIEDDDLEALRGRIGKRQSLGVEGQCRFQKQQRGNQERNQPPAGS